MGSNNSFKNIRDNCQKFYKKGFKRWLSWPIFYFISPGKFIVLCALIITLIVSGIGLYALLVLLLLVLLFIFIP
ncbi:hypothetical protein KQI77_00400 [Clostridium sp. MSJ-8]|uniref:hypothetical protein n=1 Tax=Clostridium sp. MSJ-8 TaxID=2841510 RepID=UPI001C0ED1BE|nr:hypothetical protein [Clostridium sp. MSJ-8]MBU5486634.1 hypothetical protein [Clostridium sp. MSJ-8]